MKKEIIIVIRCLIAAVLMTAAGPSLIGGDASLSLYIVFSVYLATIAGMAVFPFLPVRMENTFKWLFILDMLAITLVIAQAGERHEEFYIAYFLSVLVSAAARSVALSFVSAVVASLFYAWLTLNGQTGVELFSTPFAIRVVLFYVVSMFVGYLAEEASVCRRLRSLAEERYRDLSGRSEMGILLTDDRRRLLEANPAAETLLGASLIPHVGATLDEILRRSPSPALEAVVNRLTEGELFSDEIEVGEGEDARVVDVQCERLTADERTYVQLFCRDVTRTRVIRRHRERIDKLAAMGRLTAGIAHELNNPLTSILGYADLLRQGVYRGDPTEVAERLYTETRRMARVVKDFLTFASRENLRLEAVDLNALCAEVVGVWRQELQADGAEIRTAFAVGLPPIRADEERLKIAIMNLLDNGREAVRRLKRPGSVTIATERREGRVRLTVADTGGGIPAEIRDRIFEPFVSTKPQYHNVGMGLSVTYGIVREHGGDIVVESGEGEGTVFHVDLPVYTVSA